MSLRNVLIIGASGNVGKPTVNALLKAGGFTITALTRKGSSSTFPSEVKVHNIDDTYPQDQLLEAFKDQDVVINLLPPMDVTQHNSIADTAAQAGVKRFIPPEFGSDTSSPEILKLIPMFNNKAAIINYLKTKESSGLSWTALVNGAFFDWGLTTGFLGYDLKAKTANIFDAGDVPVCFTTLSDVGQSIVGILSNPKETANRYAYVRTVTVSQNQVLAALEKSTGEKWSTNKKDSTEARKSGSEKLSKGDMSGVADHITGGIYSGEPAAIYDKTRKLDNGLFGLKDVGLEELVDQIVKGQTV